MGFLGGFLWVGFLLATLPEGEGTVRLPLQLLTAPRQPLPLIFHLLTQLLLQPATIHHCAPERNGSYPEDLWIRKTALRIRFLFFSPVAFKMTKNQCCGSGIRCPFDPWIRDPGWVKKLGSGSRMNNSDHISESLETIFCVKIILWWGSGMEKIWIWDGKNLDPG